MNQYPIELTRAPVHVVALTYLQDYHKIISSCLTELFDTLKVLSFAGETSLPVKKVRKSFEGYRPYGLMKRDWLKKHQEDIPSVVMILVEWKPEQSNWREQEQSIMAQVDKMKKRATNRNTKFLLVIITKTKPKDITIVSPANDTENMETETLKVDDFYSWLKKSCNMESFKHVQQIDEQDLGNTSVINSKLGRILQELSAQYYKEQATRVKKMKSEVNTVLQPYLFVRHRFKVAFYTEISLRSFTQGSNPLTSASNQKIVKYLVQSYSYLMAINTKDHGISENEIKTVGDIVNFKICQMKLADKKSVDQGVKQFLKHITWYKPMVNDHKKRGLLFKHYALVYRQYRMFGEMLETVPAAHLKRDDSYHNPGYFFQAAASQAKFRKSTFVNQCEKYRQPIETILQNNAAVIEELRKDNEACYEGYYGQQIEMDAQSLFGEQLKENKIELKDIPNRLIFRDVAKEVMTVKHSEDIVSMLTKAYNHYKKQRTMKRLIYSLASSIAEEHYYSKQWDRAKEFFDRIYKTYKKEQWFDLLTSVRRLSLTCSKEMNKSKDYLVNLIDLMSTKLETTLPEKIAYMDELLSFLNSTHENGLPPIPADSPLLVEVDSKHVLLSMKLQFGRPFACVHESVPLNLQFTCHSPKPITFQKMQVRFKDKSYSFTLTDKQDLSTVFTYTDTPQQVSEKDESKKIQQTNEVKKESVDQSNSHILDLTLQPNGATTMFSFPMIIKEKQEFECESVNLFLIGQNGQQICFQWKMQDNKYYSSLLANYDFRYEINQEGLFVERPVIRITQPKPKLEIRFEHKPPALINEYYALKILLNSNGDNVIRGKLHLNQISSVKPYYFVNNEFQEVLPTGIPVSDIAANSTKEVVVFLQCLSPGMIRLKTSFEYESSTYPSLSQDADLDIYVQYPLDATFTFMGSRSTGQDSFRLVPSQTLSFFQKIINNTCHNVAVNDPLKQQQSAQQVDNQFRYNDGFPAQQQIVLSTTLSCNTPYSLQVDRVQLVPADQPGDGITNIEYCSAQVVDFEEKRRLDDTTSVPSSFVGKDYVEQRDSYTLNHVLKPNISGRNVKTGSLLVTCHRLKQHIYNVTDNDRNITSITYEIPLPNLNIFHRNLRATFDSPSEAVLGKPFQVTLTIHNDSSTLQELQLQVSDCESFFFSGTTLLNFTILPFSQKTMTYTMIPVRTGNVSFPKFTVKALREQVHVLTEREKWTIFVHMM